MVSIILHTATLPLGSNTSLFLNKKEYR